MRIGFIGAGGIAGHHATSLSRHADARIAGVVDVDATVAHALAEQVGACVYPSVADLLRHVDAVYVLTPPRSRLEIIRQVAAAGKPILCEKPLAATVDDGEEIVRVVERAGVPLMMGFMRRWHRPAQQLKRIVETGELGRPLQIVRTRVGTVTPSAGNWRIEPGQRCGVTIESLSHDVDLVRWLGGDVVAASGMTLESRPDLPGFDDNVAATLRFVDGPIGSVQLSWTSAVGYNQTAVVGERGSAILEGRHMWASQTLRTRVEGGGEHVVEYPPEVANDMGYDGENSAFVDLARGRDVTHPTARDGLAALVVAEAVLDCAMESLPHAPASSADRPLRG
ncbi:Gfo/Idh/MocA family protein [Georgenia alba]|uniref:Gfo/Idh/MocA family protein n=1 Tax=Georgenia alba TaxID=2233858 RepID=A0ABW2Q858_9MICO